MPSNTPLTVPTSDVTPRHEPASSALSPFFGEETRRATPSTLETTQTPHLGPVAGKRLGIVVSAGSSRHLVEHVKRRFEALGVLADLVIPTHSTRRFDDRTEIDAQHTLADTPSTNFDFVVFLPGLESADTVSQEITQWAVPLRNQAKPIAIGAQAAARLGVSIDNAAVFDVSTCDAFVQVCKEAASGATASQTES